VRIRVGDIELDGQDIRIGGQSVLPGSSHSQVHVQVSGQAGQAGQVIVQQRSIQPAPHGQPQPQPRELAVRDAPTESLALLPSSAALLPTGGALLLVAAVLWAVFPVGSLMALALHVLPSVFGLGLLGLGIAKRSEEHRLREAARARDDAELAPHVERVRAALAAQNPEQTVEWLTAQLGLPETTVVRVLDRLRRAGEVEEELNVDSGDWYYFARRQLGEGRDLASRMAALKQGRKE
jgi:hypothetical protein